MAPLGRLTRTRLRQTVLGRRVRWNLLDFCAHRPHFRANARTRLPYFVVLVMQYILYGTYLANVLSLSIFRSREKD